MAYKLIKLDYKEVTNYNLSYDRLNDNRIATICLERNGNTLYISINRIGAYSEWAEYSVSLHLKNGDSIMRRKKNIVDAIKLFNQLKLEL